MKLMLSTLLTLGLAAAAPRAGAQAQNPDDSVEAALESTSADDAVEPEPPPPRKRGKPGTFFLGELGAGMLFGPEGGRLVGGTFGVGGMWRGFPVRFYAIGEIEAIGGMTHDGFYDDGTPVQDELSMLAMGLGVRAYIPLAGPLRLLTEATAGSVRMTARATSSAGVFEESINRGYVALGIGPQVRVHHHLSLGVRYESMWIDFSGVSSASNLSVWEPAARNRSRVLGTATFHF
ncbi:MAG: hypothetical protein R3B13_08960 [Polyangiaceae bacterium]